MLSMLNRLSSANWGMLLIAGVMIASAVGCGAGNGAVMVSGTVTYQSQPVEAGEIIFIPADTNLPSVAGKIEQGKYTCEVPKGENQVSVTAFREVPGKFDTSNPGQKNPLMEMYSPQKYNSKSELKVAVDAPKDDLNFQL